MTDQRPHPGRVAPFVRGGEKKSVLEVGTSQLLGAGLNAGESCERVLLDCQPSATGWTPVLLDTPGFVNTSLEEKNSLPALPLPGPMYPATR